MKIGMEVNYLAADAQTMDILAKNKVESVQIENHDLTFYEVNYGTY